MPRPSFAPPSARARRTTAPSCGGSRHAPGAADSPGCRPAGVLVAVLVGLVAVAVYSPLLALHHIDVEGTSRLDSATVVKAVDGQMGVPLGLLDNGRLERELAAFTLIRSYPSSFVPPDTMVIRISERQPIGTICRSADGYTAGAIPPGVIIDTITDAAATVYPLIELKGWRRRSATGASTARWPRCCWRCPPSVRRPGDRDLGHAPRDDVTLTLTAPAQRVRVGERGGVGAQKATALAEPPLPGFNAGSGAGEYDVLLHPKSPVFRRRTDRARRMARHARAASGARPYREEREHSTEKYSEPQVRG